MKSFCNAVLRHPNGRHYVFCELEAEHQAFHQALNMAWFGDEDTTADIKDWERAKQFMMKEVYARIGK